MAEMEALPDEPTVLDLTRAVHQIHGCLEDHKRTVDQSFDRVDVRFTGVEEKLDSLGKVLGNVRSAQTSVRRALGSEKIRTDGRLKRLEDGQGAMLKAVRPDPEKPTVAAVSQSTALKAISIVGALAAVPGVIALVKFLTPLITAALAAAGAVH